MNKKDAIPVIIAALVALVVTALVKWLLPSAPSGSVQQKQSQQKEIPMPEIPLAVKKEQKKKRTKKTESFVLVVTDNFKKNEKINLKKLKWEKWPHDAVQPYFIAKDHQNKPLNNGADYSNSLKMWAKSDIPNGVPLIMAMLTDVDPVKKAEEEKKKREAEKRKQKAEEEKKKAQQKKKDVIKKGMRAVTFSINQRSATALSMLSVGDYVDVLIMTQEKGRSRTRVYKGMRIIALDGVTSNEAEKNKAKENNKNGGFLSSVGGFVSSLAAPKNVTLEVPEKLVESMLAQSESNGVILSLRSQAEIQEEQKKQAEAEKLWKKQQEEAKARGELVGSENGVNTATGIGEAKTNPPKFDPLLENLIKISSRAYVSDHQLQEKKKRIAKEKSDRELVENLLLISGNMKGAPSTTQLKEKAKQQEAEDNFNQLKNIFMHTNDNFSSPSYVQIRERSKKMKDKHEAEMISKVFMQIGLNQIAPSYTQLKEKNEKKKKEEENELLANFLMKVGNDISPSYSQLKDKKERKKKEEEDNYLTSCLMQIGSSPVPSYAQLKEKNEKKKKEEENAVLLNNLMAQSASMAMIDWKKMRYANRYRGYGGQYEIISGKVIGEEIPEKDPKTATIYRKLTASAVEFDENGWPIKNDEGTENGKPSSNSKSSSSYASR